MIAAKPNPYDEVAYVGHAFSQTHPDRLATLATLFGLKPAPVESCRVLELGCGDGGNLIPMAYGLPESRFVGVDLAARPIDQGNSLIAEIGIGNIELHCGDIAAIDRRLGQFDYIIAHGVYSWIPVEVRERMLALARELLAPNGVAYLSYNTYPGCYLRRMVREMMLFHSRGVSEPAERVQQGLAVLPLILSKFSEPAERKSELYRAVVADQFEQLSDCRHQEQIFHDDLASINEPVYFHEFMSQVERHGLQYLAEANFFEMQDYIYPPPVREFLHRFGPERVIEKEQYLDFLKGRGFRQTLLCRKEEQLDRSPDPRRIRSFFIESPARPVSAQPDLSQGTIENFRGARGAQVQTDHSLAKAAFWALGEASPRALSWEELTAEAARLSGSRQALDGESIETLDEILMSAYGAGLVELHTTRPRFAMTVSEKPVASRLARAQARRGGAVANLLHKIVELDDEPSRRLLGMLDGSRDRAALCREMTIWLQGRGQFTGPHGANLNDEAGIREIMAKAIDVNLQRIAGMALLVA